MSEEKDTLFECSTCGEKHKNLGLTKACEKRHQIAEEQARMRKEEEEYMKEQERQEKQAEPDPLEEKLARYLYLKRRNKTPFKQLTDEDKEPLRHEARKIIKIFHEHSKEDFFIPAQVCPEELQLLSVNDSVGLRVQGAIIDKGVQVSSVELIR